MLIELAVVLIVRVRWTDAEQQDCWPNETQRWSPPSGPNRRPHKVLSPLALAADWILLNSILAAWTLQASPRETRTHCKAPALVSRCRRVGAIWLDEAALIFFFGTVVDVLSLAHQSMWIKRSQSVGQSVSFGLVGRSIGWLEEEGFWRMLSVSRSTCTIRYNLSLGNKK